MSFFDSVILGFIQGVTEFLPVSSTGHLILVRDLLSINLENSLAYDAILQLATSIAVFLYFRNDFIKLIKDFRRFILRKPGDYIFLKAIIIGTIPAIILGLLFKDQIESIFRSSLSVALALIAGSILFYFAEKYGGGGEEITPQKGLRIGLFQSLALIPGMSRSGSTISGGLFSKLSRYEAARFSFILSFPIIFGAGLYELVGLWQQGSLGTLGSSLIWGSISAFFFGIISIHYLLKYLRGHSLNVFIVYRLLLAFVILIILA